MPLVLPQIPVNVASLALPPPGSESNSGSQGGPEIGLLVAGLVVLIAAAAVIGLVLARKVRRDITGNVATAIARIHPGALDIGERVLAAIPCRADDLPPAVELSNPRSVALPQDEEASGVFTRLRPGTPLILVTTDRRVLLWRQSEISGGPGRLVHELPRQILRDFQVLDGSRTGSRESNILWFQLVDNRVLTVEVNRKQNTDKIASSCRHLLARAS